MKYTKKPQTIPHQIALLQSRGLQVADVSHAEAALTHINYYRLRGYWLPFESDPQKHLFQKGATFEAVLDLYEFDRKLRLRVIDAIERIEVSVHTRWAYCLSLRHGSHAYLDASLFRDSRKYADSLKKLEEEFDRSKETFVEHYKKTYTDPGLPPLWAVCEIIPLGNLSKWIENLRDISLRSEIAMPYQLDEYVLVSFLHHLTVIRNICAHHCRLWNRKIGLKPKLPRKKPPSLWASFYPASEGYIYNTLVLLIHFLDCVGNHHQLRKHLRELFNSYPNVPLKSMGFPNNWESLPIWRE